MSEDPRRVRIGITVLKAEYWRVRITFHSAIISANNEINNCHSCPQYPIPGSVCQK